MTRPSKRSAIVGISTKYAASFLAIAFLPAAVLLAGALAGATFLALTVRLRVRPAYLRPAPGRLTGTLTLSVRNAPWAVANVSLLLELVNRVLEHSAAVTVVIKHVE